MNGNGNGNGNENLFVDVNAPTVGWLTSINGNGKGNVDLLRRYSTVAIANGNGNGIGPCASLCSFACDGQCLGEIRRALQVGNRAKTLCNPNQWNMRLIAIVESKGTVADIGFLPLCSIPFTKHYGEQYITTKLEACLHTV